MPEHFSNKTSYQLDFSRNRCIVMVHTFAELCIDPEFVISFRLRVSFCVYSLLALIASTAYPVIWSPFFEP